jgi:hypothetical protein
LLFFITCNDTRSAHLNTYYRNSKHPKQYRSLAKKKSKSTEKKTDDSDDEGNGQPKNKKPTPAKLKDSYVLQVADLATLERLCIGVQFMYWSAKFPSAACLMLVQRYKYVCMSRDVLECR